MQRGRFVDGTIVIPGGDSLQTARTDLGALFISGRVGVLGPTRYAANTVKALADLNLPFDWDIVPLPHHQRAKESITGVVGWGVSARTKHPEAAVALLRFMAGPEVQAALAAQGRIMPTLRSVARSDAFLHLPGRPENRNLLLELSEKSKMQRWPRLLRFNYIFREEISENALQSNRVTAAEAARRFQSAWDAERASSRNRPAGELISWRPVIGGTLALCLALLAWGTWQSRRVWRHPGRRGEALAGLGFASPWLAGFVLFTGGPILVSLILSFTQWSPLTPLSEAHWAGWSNYKEIFWEDRTTWQAFLNTLYFAALVVPPTQVGALGLALLLTARLRAVAFFRTVFFVPSLVTGVALATLGFMFFSAKYGLVNAVLTPLLKPFGKMPPDWLNVDASHWGFPALVLLAMWGMGGAMVVYIAALKNVPAELYEAAQIEGAGPWQRFCKVTLPLISPILQFNFVMGLIHSFHVFGLVLIMTRGGPNHATEVVALRIYNFAFESLQMGYASAMAWLLLLLTLFLTFCALRLSSSRIHYENLR